MSRKKIILLSLSIFCCGKITQSFAADQIAKEYIVPLQAEGALGPETIPPIKQPTPKPPTAPAATTASPMPLLPAQNNGGK